MKTSKRFDNAISALVSGYLNGTLAKGSCMACAVGNMVAKGLGLKARLLSDDSFGDWANVFCTNYGIQEIKHFNYRSMAKKEIDSTGYKWYELALVEKVFEENTKIYWFEYGVFSEKEIDQDQLKGLYAVVDTLCEIEGYSNEKANECKELFVK